MLTPRPTVYPSIKRLERKSVTTSQYHDSTVPVPSATSARTTPDQNKIDVIHPAFFKLGHYRAVDAKLAEFRKKSGGKPPNILYILIDDVGFGLSSFSLGGRWT